MLGKQVNAYGLAPWGSDKFSIYPIMNRLIKKHDAGLHVKTAGTTWLEEVIGLAESGAKG